MTISPKYGYEKDNYPNRIPKLTLSELIRMYGIDHIRNVMKGGLDNEMFLQKYEIFMLIKNLELEMRISRDEISMYEQRIEKMQDGGVSLDSLDLLDNRDIGSIYNSMIELYRTSLFNFFMLSIEYRLISEGGEVNNLDESGIDSLRMHCVNNTGVAMDELMSAYVKDVFYEHFKTKNYKNLKTLQQRKGIERLRSSDEEERIARLNGIKDSVINNIEMRDDLPPLEEIISIATTAAESEHFIEKKDKLILDGSVLSDYLTKWLFGLDEKNNSLHGNGNVQITDLCSKLDKITAETIQECIVDVLKINASSKDLFYESIIIESSYISFFKEAFLGLLTTIDGEEIRANVVVQLPGLMKKKMVSHKDKVSGKVFAYESQIGPTFSRLLQNCYDEENKDEEEVRKNIITVLGNSKEVDKQQQFEKAKDGMHELGTNSLRIALDVQVSAHQQRIIKHQAKIVEKKEKRQNLITSLGLEEDTDLLETYEKYLKLREQSKKIALDVDSGDERIKNIDQFFAFVEEKQFTARDRTKERLRQLREDELIPTIKLLNEDVGQQMENEFYWELYTSGKITLRDYRYKILGLKNIDLLNEQGEIYTFVDKQFIDAIRRIDKQTEELKRRGIEVRHNQSSKEVLIALQKYAKSLVTNYFDLVLQSFPKQDKVDRIELKKYVYHIFAKSIEGTVACLMSVNPFIKTPKDQDMVSIFHMIFSQVITPQGSTTIKILTGLGGTDKGLPGRVVGYGFAGAAMQNALTSMNYRSLYDLFHASDISIQVNNLVAETAHLNAESSSTLQKKFIQWLLQDPAGISYTHTGFEDLDQEMVQSIEFLIKDIYADGTDQTFVSYMNEMIERAKAHFHKNGEQIDDDGAFDHAVRYNAVHPLLFSNFLSLKNTTDFVVKIGSPGEDAFNYIQKIVTEKLFQSSQHSMDGYYMPNIMPLVSHTGDGKITGWGYEPLNLTIDGGDTPAYYQVNDHDLPLNAINNFASFEDLLAHYKNDPILQSVVHDFELMRDAVSIHMDIDAQQAGMVLLWFYKQMAKESSDFSERKRHVLSKMSNVRLYELDTVSNLHELVAPVFNRNGSFAPEYDVLIGILQEYFSDFSSPEKTNAMLEQLKQNTVGQSGGHLSVFSDTPISSFGVQGEVNRHAAHHSEGRQFAFHFPSSRINLNNKLGPIFRFTNGSTLSIKKGKQWKQAQVLFVAIDAADIEALSIELEKISPYTRTPGNKITKEEYEYVSQFINHATNMLCPGASQELSSILTSFMSETYNKLSESSPTENVFIDAEKISLLFIKKLLGNKNSLLYQIFNDPDKRTLFMKTFSGIGTGWDVNKNQSPFVRVEESTDGIKDFKRERNALVYYMPEEENDRSPQVLLALLEKNEIYPTGVMKFFSFICLGGLLLLGGQYQSKYTSQIINQYKQFIRQLKLSGEYDVDTLSTAPIVSIVTPMWGMSGEGNDVSYIHGLQLLQKPLNDTELEDIVHGIPGNEMLNAALPVICEIEGGPLSQNVQYAGQGPNFISR